MFFDNIHFLDYFVIKELYVERWQMKPKEIGRKEEWPKSAEITVFTQIYAKNNKSSVLDTIW